MAANDSVGPAEGIREPHRVLKPDLFMAIALWMETSPLAEPPPSIGSPIPFKKSGAVYVLPNDRALSVDFSQNGVHAAVSALNKFGQERAKGCQVYLSRRPCSSCAKLLVQCGVSKVFYLPIEPELMDDEDIRRVDSIFLTANVGLSIKVPKIDELIFQDHDHKQSPYREQRSPRSGPEEVYLQRLMRIYWNEHWVEVAKRELRWEAFDDLKDQITEDMNALLKWIAHTTVFDVPDNVRFIEIVADLKYKDEKTPTEHGSATPTDDANQSSIQQGTVANPRANDGSPNPSDEEWQKFALHMSRLAQMLSQRSDDPARGVGCVLTLHNEIVAIGWNGFPAKALYGEFPRASNTPEERAKKEPYVIHAEQNALLTRTKRILKHESAVLFINEIPCDQCIPMLLQAEVMSFVIPKVTAPSEADPQPPQRNLQDAQRKGITCYGSKRVSTPRASTASTAPRASTQTPAARKLFQAEEEGR